MKKALYITNLGLMDNLGMTQILPYITGLAREGIGFTVLSYEKKDNLRSGGRIKKIKKILDANAIKWIRLEYHNRWGNLYDMLIGVAVTTKLILEDRIDVVHARASIPILISWPLAKLFGKKTIYDRRGTIKGDFIDDVNLKNIFFTGFFPRMLDSIDRFFVRHSDAVIVLSERSKQLLKKGELVDKERVICDSIPCCVDIKKFANADYADENSINLRDKFVMAYVGSLGTCYLLNEMIDFFRTLKERVENAFFLVISHSDKGMIHEHFSNKQVADRDYAIMDVRPEEVPRWLAKAGCSVMFIKEVECKIGSSPTKFAESLAAGVPVIINKGIGDADALVGKNRIGCIVESLNRSGYLKALSGLTELLKDPLSLKKRCKDAAGAHFSMGRGIEKYKSIYEKL